jgi:hypothetical protein
VPEPLDPDGVRTVTVGTALWGLAVLVLLPFELTGRLDGRHAALWVCVTGFGLGLVGIAYCVRRRDSIARGGSAP